MSTREQFLSSLGASMLAAAPLPGYTATTTIGVVVPLSGNARRAGEDVLNGVRAAIDDENARRSPLDRAYAFKTYDDHNDAAEALVEAGFAGGDTDVVAVIGHLATRTTAVALPTYQGAQLPVIVPTSTDDRLTEDRRFTTIFRLPARDQIEGEALARNVVRAAKPSKPFILVQDGDYGADVATGLIQGFKTFGITAPYLQYAWERPNLTDVVARVKAAAPDHLLLAGTATDMGSTLDAVRAGGYTGPISASQGFFDRATVTTHAKAAEGMRVSSSMPYLPLAPQTIRIQRDYEQRYGAPFSLLPVFGYAAAQVAIAAAKRAGNPTRLSVLRQLQTAVPIDTVIGPLAFSAGDVLDPNVYFYTVAGGAFKYERQSKPGGYLLR